MSMYLQRHQELLSGPAFWTMQFGRQYQFNGDSTGYMMLMVMGTKAQILELVDWVWKPTCKSGLTPETFMLKIQWGRAEVDPEEVDFGKLARLVEALNIHGLTTDLDADQGRTFRSSGDYMLPTRWSLELIGEEEVPRDKYKIYEELTCIVPMEPTYMTPEEETVWETHTQGNTVDFGPVFYQDVSWIWNELQEFLEMRWERVKEVKAMELMKNIFQHVHLRSRFNWKQ